MMVVVSIQFLDVQIQSLNYDPTVLIDDGSCIYPLLGCTDSTAIILILLPLMVVVSLIFMDVQIH